MTVDAFIKRVIDEATEGGTIPTAPNEKSIKQIIKEAIRYFQENADEAVHFEYIIIDNKITDSPMFKDKRQVQLPSCIEAVTGLSEVGGLLSVGSNNINPDYRKTNFNYHLAVAGDSDSMLYGVIASYYSDFMRNFIVRKVRYSYNPHSNILTIEGRDHFHDLICEAYVHISDESIFEMERFFRYVVGKVKMRFANIFGFVNQKLIGGIQLNIQDMKSDGRDMVKQVEEELKEDRQTMDWWDEF